MPELLVQNKRKEINEKVSIKMRGRKRNEQTLREKNKWSSEKRELQSQKLKNYYLHNPKVRGLSRKKWSEEAKERQRGKRKGLSGGFREGSGRSKTGYYKGIYCGSTYELVWVIYNIDKAINFQRFEGFILYNNTKYFPDFIQGNTIIEIKGVDINNTMPMKAEASINAGYSIKILYREHLQEQFDYVSKNYQYRKLEELYDTYKPKYMVICEKCKIEFKTDRKHRKRCSRKCAGYVAKVT